MQERSLVPSRGTMVALGFQKDGTISIHLGDVLVALSSSGNCKLNSGTIQSPICVRDCFPFQEDNNRRNMGVYCLLGNSVMDFLVPVAYHPDGVCFLG